MLMQAAQLASSRTWRSRVCLLRQMALMHQMRLAGCLRICVCVRAAVSWGSCASGIPGSPAIRTVWVLPASACQASCRVTALPSIPVAVSSGVLLSKGVPEWCTIHGHVRAFSWGERQSAFCASMSAPNPDAVCSPWQAEARARLSGQRLCPAPWLQEPAIVCQKAIRRPDTLRTLSVRTSGCPGRPGLLCLLSHLPGQAQGEGGRISPVQGASAQLPLSLPLLPSMVHGCAASAAGSGCTRRQTQLWPAAGRAAHPRVLVQAVSSGKRCRLQWSAAFQLVREAAHWCKSSPVALFSLVYCGILRQKPVNLHQNIDAFILLTSFF